MPSPSGSARSSTATSTPCSSPRASASDWAWPTTVKSDSRSNMPAIASRTAVWSSTSKTRTCSAARSCAGRSGTSKRTVVPVVGSPTMSRRPWRSAARSRIPAIPCPAPRAGRSAGSNPRPSSETSAWSLPSEPHTLTRTRRARAWPRAFVSASPRMRSVSVPVAPSGPAGIPRRNNQFALRVDLHRPSRVHGDGATPASQDGVPQLRRPQGQLLRRIATAQRQAHALERRRQLVRRRADAAGAAGTRRERQRVREVLERLVVQVARDPAPIRLQRVEQPLSCARLRSTALASTLATACTRLTSDGENDRRRVADSASSTPKVIRIGVPSEALASCSPEVGLGACVPVSGSAGGEVADLRLRRHKPGVRWPRTVRSGSAWSWSAGRCSRRRRAGRRR